MKRPKVYYHPAVIAFADRHSLKLTEILSRQELLIESTSRVLLSINSSYANLGDKELRDPAVGVLLNIIHRNFEHIEGSIVAFATGCASSSEVISRASVEASISALYIMSGNRRDRLVSWFKYYLDGVDSQIDRWQREGAALDPTEGSAHLSGAAVRRKANAVMRAFVREAFGETDEVWPRQIIDRFRGIGNTIAYRTVYSRMSSETHADAEETIRFIIGKVIPNEKYHAEMASETIWTSIFYIQYSVFMFLKTCESYADSYGLRMARVHIEQALEKLQAELARTVLHIGGDAAAESLLRVV